MSSRFMDADDNERYWYDDNQLYSSGRDSDDSPLLSQRICEKRRCAAYPPAKADERERRSTLSLLTKLFLFCAAMIMFCVLLYIPVYNKANYQVSKALVAGWSTHTNRDTKLYVLPNNVTIIHEPTAVCMTNNKKRLFLLIVVCSSTENFERRVAIRNSWGSYKIYLNLSKTFNLVRERYKNYNYTYDLYKREVPSFSLLIPEIAKLLRSNLANPQTDSVPEKRFDDDDDDVGDKGDGNDLFQEFDMNKEIGDKVSDNENAYKNYDYNENSNVMKIPPKGFEDNPDIEKVLNLLKADRDFPEIKEDLENGNTEVDFKLVFLLGLPVQRNVSTVQDKIEEEVEKYGDVLQEGFIDSYNNLTLKSIMMLKWINNKCIDSVRYILKTDDDMYVNVPNLIFNLKNRSQHYDEKTDKGPSEEYLLIGDLICGARPVLDSRNKWYSPRYMYGGRIYPRYLSGTGYLFSAPAAKALYAAALRTPYFHLEDIYITGICALRSTPRLTPHDDSLFSLEARPIEMCTAHGRATLHRVAVAEMRTLSELLQGAPLVDVCERKRLTQVRQDRLKPKTQPKRLTKHLHVN